MICVNIHTCILRSYLKQSYLISWIVARKMPQNIGWMGGHVICFTCGFLAVDCHTIATEANMLVPFPVGASEPHSTSASCC